MARKLKPSEQVAGIHAGKVKPNEPIEKVLARSVGAVDSELLLKSLIEVWGGPQRLALDIHKEYQNAVSGGVTRARILEMLQRLIITNTTQDLGRPTPASDLSDEELAEAFRLYSEKISGGSSQAEG